MGDKRKHSFATYAAQQQRRGVSIKPKCCLHKAEHADIGNNRRYCSHELTDIYLIRSALFSYRVDTMFAVLSRRKHATHALFVETVAYMVMDSNEYNNAQCESMTRYNT